MATSLHLTRWSQCDRAFLLIGPLHLRGDGFHERDHHHHRLREGKNSHVFLGPGDFNGYGYFYARSYWTAFDLQANTVEEYVLLSVLLRVAET